MNTPCPACETATCQCLMCGALCSEPCIHPDTIRTEPAPGTVLEENAELYTAIRHGSLSLALMAARRNS